jgi:hypothetical protein
VRHGTCFHRRLSTRRAGVVPHSAVAELGVVRRRSRLVKTIVAALLFLTTLSGATDESTAAYKRGYLVRYIDTPRQFSISAVTELTKVAVGAAGGRQATISESTFNWNERCIALLTDHVGVPPRDGSLSYDATYDRLSVFSDRAYFDRLLHFLSERFPKQFRNETKPK